LLIIKYFGQLYFHSKGFIKYQQKIKKHSNSSFRCHTGWLATMVSPLAGLDLTEPQAALFAKIFLFDKYLPDKKYLGK
jgi:hypothetical protein